MHVCVHSVARMHAHAIALICMWTCEVEDRGQGTEHVILGRF